MSADRNIIRVFIRGGIVSPLEMKKVLEAAKKMGNKSIHFGSRQDILFHANDEYVEALNNTLSKSNIDFIHEKEVERYQNIVSSYVSAGILPSTNWVTSGTYLWLLEGFYKLTTLRVNIVDPRQNLVPLFNGNLNFIASNQENYWYLKIKFPGETQISTWPVLVFIDDIHALVYDIEEAYEGGLTDVDLLFKSVNIDTNYNNKNFKIDISIPKGFFPYYEGVNRMLSGGRQWIGFYWRNNRYDVSFLEELCDLCIQTGVAKLCITPWKSFLIKEIGTKDELLWERLIGRYGINMRHSSTELNWHLPVLNNEALDLKSYIVKQFDQVDIRTFGLTFSIGTSVADAFTSILIQKEISKSLRSTYKVLTTKNFGLNNTTYTVYAERLSKRKIPLVLMELCKSYYEMLGEETVDVIPEKQIVEKTTESVFQCSCCYTIYDEQMGDAVQGISPGTAFNLLPEKYKCPTCESAISSFEATNIASEMIR